MSKERDDRNEDEFFDWLTSAEESGESGGNLDNELDEQEGAFKLPEGVTQTDYLEAALDDKDASHEEILEKLKEIADERVVQDETERLRQEADSLRKRTEELREFRETVADLDNTPTIDISEFGLGEEGDDTVVKDRNNLEKTSESDKKPKVDDIMPEIRARAASGEVGKDFSERFRRYQAQKDSDDLGLDSSKMHETLGRNIDKDDFENTETNDFIVESEARDIKRGLELGLLSADDYVAIKELALANEAEENNPEFLARKKQEIEAIIKNDKEENGSRARKEDYLDKFISRIDKKIKERADKADKTHVNSDEKDEFDFMADIDTTKSGSGASPFDRTKTIDKTPADEKRDKFAEVQRQRQEKIAQREAEDSDDSETAGDKFWKGALDDTDKEETPEDRFDRLRAEEPPINPYDDTAVNVATDRHEPVVEQEERPNNESWLLDDDLAREVKFLPDDEFLTIAELHEVAREGTNIDPDFWRDKQKEINELARDGKISRELADNLIRRINDNVDFGEGEVNDSESFDRNSTITFLLNTDDTVTNKDIWNERRRGLLKLSDDELRNLARHREELMDASTLPTQPTESSSWVEGAPLIPTGESWHSSEPIVIQPEGANRTDSDDVVDALARAATAMERSVDRTKRVEEMDVPEQLAMVREDLSVIESALVDTSDHSIREQVLRLDRLVNTNKLEASVAREVKARLVLHDTSFLMRTARGRIVDDDNPKETIPAAINRLTGRLKRPLTGETIEALLVDGIPDYAIGEAWDVLQDAIYDYPNVLVEVNRANRGTRGWEDVAIVDVSVEADEIYQSKLPVNYALENRERVKEAVKSHLINNIKATINISPARLSELGLSSPAEIDKYKTDVAAYSLQLADDFRYATLESSIHNSKQSIGPEQLGDCIEFQYHRRAKKETGGIFGPEIHLDNESLDGFGTSVLRRAYKIKGTGPLKVFDIVREVERGQYTQGPKAGEPKNPQGFSELNAGNFADYESYAKSLKLIYDAMMDITPSTKDYMKGQGEFLKKFNKAANKVDPANNNNLRINFISGIVYEALRLDPLDAKANLSKDEQDQYWSGTDIKRLFDYCRRVKDEKSVDANGNALSFLTEEEIKWIQKAVPKADNQSLNRREGISGFVNTLFKTFNLNGN